MFIDKLRRLFKLSQTVNSVALTKDDHDGEQLLTIVKSNIKEISKIDLSRPDLDDPLNRNLLNVSFETKVAHASDLIDRCRIFLLDLSNLSIFGEDYDIKTENMLPLGIYVSVANFQYNGKTDVTVTKTITALTSILHEIDSALSLIEDDASNIINMSIGRFIKLMSEVGEYISAINRL